MRLCAIHLLVNSSELMLKLSELRLVFLFLLHQHPTNENTFATYLPSYWCKSLWRFTSNTLYKLDISEDYPDLDLLRVDDVFLTQTFVDAGSRGVDLKSLNFVRKYIQAISLADIASIDGHRISNQAFEACSSNCLRDNTD